VTGRTGDGRAVIFAGWAGVQPSLVRCQGFVISGAAMSTKRATAYGQRSEISSSSAALFTYLIDVTRSRASLALSTTEGLSEMSRTR
jgi:hypothetical protein